jgi:hypothetical protein
MEYDGVRDLEMKVSKSSRTFIGKDAMSCKDTNGSDINLLNRSVARSHRSKRFKFNHSRPNKFGVSISVSKTQRNQNHATSKYTVGKTPFATAQESSSPLQIDDLESHSLTSPPSVFPDEKKGEIFVSQHQRPRIRRFTTISSIDLLDLVFKKEALTAKTLKTVVGENRKAFGDSSGRLKKRSQSQIVMPRQGIEFTIGDLRNRMPVGKPHKFQRPQVVNERPFSESQSQL